MATRRRLRPAGRRNRQAPPWRSENAAKAMPQVLAITTPERGIDTEDDAVVGVEPEPNAVVRFEILEIEIFTTVRDLSRIVEAASRPLQISQRYSAWARIACGPRNRYSRKPRSVSFPAERRHEIKRHRLVGVGVGCRHEEPRRDHATAGQETDELTQVGIDAVERELAGGAIVVMGKVDAIPAALLRVLRLTIVDFDERVGSQEICAGVEARRFGRAERIRHVRVPIVLPLAELRRPGIDPATDEQVRDGPDAGAPTEMVRRDRVVGSISRFESGPRPKFSCG